MTALHRAIIHGHAGIVHTLLEAGCSVDETDEVNTFMQLEVFIPGWISFKVLAGSLIIFFTISLHIIAEHWSLQVTCGSFFINVFSRRAIGFYRQAKVLELNSFITKKLSAMFGKQAKSSSQLVKDTSRSPLPRCSENCMLAPYFPLKVLAFVKIPYPLCNYGPSMPPLWGGYGYFWNRENIYYYTVILWFYKMIYSLEWEHSSTWGCLEWLQ